MEVIKKGAYLGKYKENEIEYHMFSPEQIEINGKTKYVRVGDYDEEFANNRNYILSKVNKTEEELISNKK